MPRRCGIRIESTAISQVKTEIHCAAIRQPEVAALLGSWQHVTANALENLAGLTTAEAKQFFLLLIGLAHLDQVHGIDVGSHDTQTELSTVLEGWLGERYRDR